MIGFNGGLIGQTDTYARGGVNSGVWSLDELLPSKRFVVASGGTESDIVVGGVDYRVHTFNSDGTFTVTKPGFVEYLIHGGGSGGNCGQGGSHFGNGGAAGTARAGIIYAAAQAHTITVGSGSAGVAQTSSAAGGSSSAFGITATGGNAVSNTTRLGGSNADFSGGAVTSFNGGGGAGAGNNGLTVNFVGGAGFASFITGSGVIRGGGGGGAGQVNNGGQGGGGNASTTVNGGSGTANTGSGGGGGSPDAAGTTGGAGGSGVVIIRYIWK